jgi:hypothetical protein
MPVSFAKLPLLLRWPHTVPSAACRGQEDRVKRDQELAEKYLRPLSSCGRIEFRPKTPKKAVDGSKPQYMSKELKRVTPPKPGTAVYPGDNWQLPA